MKMYIHHLPSNTQWVSKDFPDDQKSVDEMHKKLTNFLRENDPYMSFETVNGTMVYLQANILKDCVITSKIAV